MRDKLMQMFKKGITLIECHTEVKTVDGFSMRVFAMGFTCRNYAQVNKNAKAGNGKRKEIRAKMVSTIQSACAGKKLSEVVNLLRKDEIEKNMAEVLKKVRPMANIIIRKIKMLRRPKLDLKELRAL